ncbi:MAG: bis(5'-nucleosyl)-tetraphosphatase (symmetrical) YqeK [Clostridia bacterium]|nr:bis(5'-nucleosyl)-tetraphosphatase (symmetrical) YqeK [Clostridia bacterium]
MRIGIFGGSFDPPHKGHLAVAEAALKSGEVDRLVILPASQQTARGTLIASATDRVNMCRLCVAGMERMEVSDLEARSPERAFTAQTLRKLRKQYRNDRLVFIIGADKLKHLADWADAQEIFSLCEFLVCPRDGVDIKASSDRAIRQGARIRVLDVPELAASSAEIQREIGAYEDSRELTPETAAYIARHWLYHDGSVLKARALMNEKRWKHTLGVRDTAVELAALYGLSIQHAALAALLHDCAKCLPFNQMLALAKEAGIQDENLLSSSAMLHGPVGAYLAERDFGVRQPDVLNAITYHTMGREGMSGLELCVFVADAIEPGRDSYPGLKRLRKLAGRSLEAAALLSLNLTRDYVIAAGKPFNPLSDATSRWLRGRVPEELICLTYASGD